MMAISVFGILVVLVILFLLVFIPVLLIIRAKTRPPEQHAVPPPYQPPVSPDD